MLTQEQRNGLALNLPLVGGFPTFPAKDSGDPFCSTLPIDSDFRAIVIHQRVYVNGPPGEESPENYGFLITCLDGTCRTFKGHVQKHFLTALVAGFLLSQKNKHAVSQLLSPETVTGLSEAGEVETETALVNAPHDEPRSAPHSLSNKHPSKKSFAGKGRDACSPGGSSPINSGEHSRTVGKKRILGGSNSSGSSSHGSEVPPLKRPKAFSTFFVSTDTCDKNEALDLQKDNDTSSPPGPSIDVVFQMSLESAGNIVDETKNPGAEENTDSPAIATPNKKLFVTDN